MIMGLENQCNACPLFSTRANISTKRNEKGRYARKYRFFSMGTPVSNNGIKISMLIENIIARMPFLVFVILPQSSFLWEKIHPANMPVVNSINRFSGK
jgi:hypothetical protein